MQAKKGKGMERSATTATRGLRNQGEGTNMSTGLKSKGPRKTVASGIREINDATEHNRVDFLR